MKKDIIEVNALLHGQQQCKRKKKVKSCLDFIRDRRKSTEINWMEDQRGLREEHGAERNGTLCYSVRGGHRKKNAPTSSGHFCEECGMWGSVGWQTTAHPEPSDVRYVHNCIVPLVYFSAVISTVDCDCPKLRAAILHLTEVATFSSSFLL